MASTFHLFQVLRIIESQPAIKGKLGSSWMEADFLLLARPLGDENIIVNQGD